MKKVTIAQAFPWLHLIFTPSTIITEVHESYFLDFSMISIGKLIPCLADELYTCSTHPSHTHTTISDILTRPDKQSKLDFTEYVFKPCLTSLFNKLRNEQSHTACHSDPNWMSHFLSHFLILLFRRIRFLDDTISAKRSQINTKEL